jgi:hypothetical protein
VGLQTTKIAKVGTVEAVPVNEVEEVTNVAAATAALKLAVAAKGVTKVTTVIGFSGAEVRCAFFDKIVHSRMPLSFTHLFCLKLLHACDQWHSSQVVTFLPVHTVNCVKH